ncbi:ABC transporter permease subunit [Micromonospora sp. NPDC006431]|uniref:ABC transporter permease subunit n=1 Tax=Micromonospora sp. NPDC006431 TaxID=3364235 RepID=UPI003691E5E2
MSTAIEPAVAAGPHAVEPAARFRDLLGAEWIKLWSLRSTYGSLVLIAVSAVLFSARAALADHHNWPNYSAERRAAFDPIHDAFPDEGWLFIVLAAGAVGAVMIAGEYASGQIRTTFAAVPARRAVVGAKVVVLAVVMLVVGVLAAGVSFGLSQAILADRGAGAALGDPGALRAVAASALLLPVCALTGLGIGALVRHTAPAIVTTTAVLLLLQLAFDTKRQWTAAIHNALPVPAWDRLVGNPYIMLNDHLATVPGSWAVLAVWPVVAALAAMAVVHRREP